MNINIIGAGYVGLVTAVGFASVKHTVRLIESDPKRRNQILSGKAPFFEPGLDAILADCLAQKLISCFASLAEATAAAGSPAEGTFICVGTPTVKGEQDLSYVRAAVKATAEQVGKSKHVIIVKSTVAPGTTSGVVKAEIKAAGSTASVAMNPEFLREGTAVEDFLKPDRIVIGVEDSFGEDVLRRLYNPFDAPVLVMSCSNAELSKYASNAFLATMISFSNEIGSVAESFVGGDANKAFESLFLDRRISKVQPNGERLMPGFVSYLKPGIGYGGSCLPKDVQALRANAIAAGEKASLLSAVEDVNQFQTVRVAKRIERALGGLTGKKIGLIGLSFKQGTDDLRDSPAVRLRSSLESQGAVVSFFDPLISGGVSNVEELAKGAHALVVTHHDTQYRVLPWTALASLMAEPKLLVDGRGILLRSQIPASLKYISIGVANES